MKAMVISADPVESQWMAMVAALTDYTVVLPHDPQETWLEVRALGEDALVLSSGAAAPDVIRGLRACGRTLYTIVSANTASEAAEATALHADDVLVGRRGFDALPDTVARAKALLEVRARLR